MPATLTIVPWTDAVLDTLGHDPRSRYVETFWLPTLGPTAVLLLRHLADRFDSQPHDPEIELRVAVTSQVLGLGHRDGNASPIVRTLGRLAQFNLACDDGRGTVAVRRYVPPINPRHARRLPPPLQVEHAHWAEQELDPGPLERRRAHSRRIALALVEQGEEPDHVERVLGAAGFHPSLAAEAARWARTRRRARAAR